MAGPAGCLRPFRAWGFVGWPGPGTEVPGFMPASLRDWRIAARWSYEMGMASFSTDEGADAIPEAGLGDQVDPGAQEVFEEDAQLHVAGEGGGLPEADEEIDVAVGGGFPSGYGAEEAEGFHSEALDFASVGRQQSQNVVSSHGMSLHLHPRPHLHQPVESVIEILQSPL